MNILMGTSGLCGCHRTGHEVQLLSERHYGQVVLLFYICLPKGEGVLEQDNTPCHRTRIVLEWFQYQNYDF